jgi:hypothetical protein
MYLPKLAEVSNKAKKSIIEFMGLDKRAAIADNALSACTNLSSRNFPLISPRLPRTASYTLTSGKALFAATKLAWVDSVTFTSPAGDITFGAHTITSATSKFGGIAVGDTLVITGCTVNTDNNATVVVTTASAATITCSATTFTITSGDPAGKETAAITFTGCSFKYDNVTKGVVTASAKCMVELLGRIVIFPDNVSYDTVGGTFASFGTGTYPTAGSVPDIDYACVLDNRIWAVEGDDVYCTALGDFDDWTTFSSPSEATDAYQVDTGTNGNFTGIVSYKGAVLAFKRDRVFKVFGTIPSDFQLIEISRLGCLDSKSICEVNDILFWLSPQGVVAYTGGSPEVISECLNESYTTGKGGGDGRWYYASLYNGTAYALYTYDTWKKIFLKEDTLQVTEFAFLDGYLYALASDNKIYKLGYGSETISSSLTTKEFSEYISNKKGHSELFCRVDLETGATMAVYVRTDNGAFTKVKDYNATDLTSFKIALKLKNADHFQIRLDMSGDYKVHQLQRMFYVGEDD